MIYIQENFLLTINSLVVVLLVENRTIAKPLEISHPLPSMFVPLIALVYTFNATHEKTFYQEIAVE